MLRVAPREECGYRGPPTVGSKGVLKRGVERIGRGEAVEIIRRTEQDALTTYTVRRVCCSEDQVMNRAKSWLARLNSGSAWLSGSSLLSSASASRLHTMPALNDLEISARCINSLPNQHHVNEEAVIQSENFVLTLPRTERPSQCIFDGAEGKCRKEFEPVVNILMESHGQHSAMADRELPAALVAKVVFSKFYYQYDLLSFPLEFDLDDGLLN